MVETEISRVRFPFALAIILVLLRVTACSTFQTPAVTTSIAPKSAPTPTNSPPAAPPSSPTSGSRPLAAIESTPTSQERWFELLQRTPYPYTTPLPAPTTTNIDGAYAKFEPREEEPVHCRRCPDYAPERGIWKLYLDKGIFRVFYEFTQWRGIGSYTVSGDRIVFFNDPSCTEDVGTYTWKLAGGRLTLKVIQDSCAIDLRAKNFTSVPWLSCRPPNVEAAISGHWQEPPGCKP